MDGLQSGSSTEEVLAAFGADSSSLANRTVIMTGATAGIGKATATALAGLGCTLVCGCRNSEKGRALVLGIEEELQGGLTSPSVFVPPLELSDLDSVRAFVADVGPRLASGEWPPLYALVLNAGLINLDGSFSSEDGMEDTFRTNHLAHFLLTQLLLPYLRAGAPSRVVPSPGNLYAPSLNLPLFWGPLMTSSFPGVGSRRVRFSMDLQLLYNYV